MQIRTVTASLRRFHPATLTAFAVATVLLAVVAVLSVTSLAYGSTVRGGDRLLPGTTIASVDVGEATPQEARARVAAHLDEQLDRPVVVTYRDERWTTTARELGATTDLDEVIAAASARADELGFTDLVELRWFGNADGLATEVAVTVPEDVVGTFVAEVAAAVDRAPRDAEVTWSDGEVAVTTAGRSGRAVDREAAATAVAAAATGSSEAEVELPVTVADPEVPTERAEEAAGRVEDVVAERFGRTVTVELGDGSTATTSAGELGAVPTLDPLVVRALDGEELAADEVELTITDEAIGEVVDAVAAGSAVAAQDARLETTGDGFRVVPEVAGAAVDRAAAIGQDRAALDGAADHVGLELRPVRPAVTAADLDQVLLVDQASTTVSLLRGGETVRSWPVAIGTNGSPTPKGTFVVGAKRYEPTWVNPARDRWGKDMPARIGPGPDNPLGLRAVNWNTTDGRDTLIRFHGTPNEASIGTASSNGCVRMYNDDVIELYDLVATGMVIVSR